VTRMLATITLLGPMYRVVGRVRGWDR
jgi:hypothetical protein